MPSTSEALIVRQATDNDTGRLAVLRRAWSEEQADGPLGDLDFEGRFAQWYEEEAPRRVTYLAELDGTPVGMVNLAEFRRMPRPGLPASHWCYLGNAFVLAAQRNHGIGTALLDAAIGHARDLGAARIVLSPSDRSMPFYQRAGFGPATMLMAKILD
ncbi:GNAT family N-acetyltransferase [Solihabitans fulvus]|uniref:GNAT family N-acetyltransferase n=1 Tax=Solihabitans fulvus TaxID=1892852 RepID=A0A5B2XVT5_9PSEU|nr:GNAT family N-acetyltransferase [Solihabitans fulvus]KAA2267110.1 GNAT family N-acetyltransferase [Solihabitans fulvus]